MSEKEESSSVGLAVRWGINSSTGALLAAILLIGMGQELWSPFMPKFIAANMRGAAGDYLGHWGLSQTAAAILAIGVYGSWKDFQEAVYYYLGGRWGGQWGTRRALIGFSFLPLIGYMLFLCAFTPALATVMTYLSLPLIAGYDAISQPAALTVVGETLQTKHRTLAFSLQAIQRRLSRILAYLGAGFLVWWFGDVGGVRVGVGVSFILVLMAVVVQFVFLKNDTKDAKAATAQMGFSMWSRFPLPLRKLLLADMAARWAEGLPRELFVLYAVGGGAVNSPETSSGKANLSGAGVFGLDARTFGILLALMSLTSLATYLPMGMLASKPGAEKKPYIGITFVFFSLFPLVFWGLGHWWGVWGLVVAYVVAGLRELGEPARKAMITELLPADSRTTATGFYWSLRSLAVMPAPLIGSVVWLMVGPSAVFVGACVIGMVGAVFFALFFSRPDVDCALDRQVRGG